MPVSGSIGTNLQKLASAIDPYLNVNFAVEIEGLLVGGFSEVSGLEAELVTERYREGGLNGFEHVFAGPVQTSEIVLSRGLIDVDTLWNWFDSAARGIVKRKNGTIMLLNLQGDPVMWWDFARALPIR